MDRYYYHGFDHGDIEWGIMQMLKISKEGINSREHLGEDFNHVCLYRKNEDFDYSKDDHILKSARGGWIDFCCGFIISPSIEAEKTRN